MALDENGNISYDEDGNFNINSEWIASASDGYYNCSDGAYKYFSFYDNNRAIPKDDPIYNQRKKENLLVDIFHGGQ